MSQNLWEEVQDHIEDIFIALQAYIRKENR